MKPLDCFILIAVFEINTQENDSAPANKVSPPLTLKNKKMIIRLAIISFFLCTTCLKSQVVEDNAGVTHVVVAKSGSTSFLYTSELDGAISAHDIKGKRLWRMTLEPKAVLFEINAADINNDGIDELISASANGNIYCHDVDGELLWEFKPKHKVRFSEVAVIKNEKVQIFAGGNDNKLYELDAKGNLVSVTKIKGVVRKIESGKFLDAKKESLFIMTYSHDKFRWDYFGFMDPLSKKTIKSLSIKKVPDANMTRAMVTDITIADIDHDQKDDILLFGDLNFKSYIMALNSNFEILMQYQGTKKETQRYAHSQGTYIENQELIMFQHGGITKTLDIKGKVLGQSGERYGAMVYNDFAVDANTNQLVAAGTVDGGDYLHFFDLNKQDWITTRYEKGGRMLEVEKNIQKLYEQTLNFKLPEYQSSSKKEWVMITAKQPNDKVLKLNGAPIKIITQKAPKESTERSELELIMGPIALKKDKRGNYKDSREDIIQMAKEFEANGHPFAFWAGHGNDPFYIRIETLEKVLEVAPNTCYGFIYAEMDNVEDPRVIHFVNDYMPRLAKAIRKHNRAKLYFRNKNMFWAATSHLPLWKELFFSDRYNDILVPASEDTSNRIQDLNLAGRIGMYAGGYVNDFAMRLVDDNPTSWRPLSPGGQNSISPFLRQGVVMAAYGARYGIIFNNPFVEEPNYDVLFALMTSGVLPVVEKENIQSIGSWHLIKNIDEHLVHSVDSHHNLLQYQEDDEEAIFSVAQMHWAGTNIPDYDFSKMLGVNYRWLNYMPTLPYGMIPIAPVEYQPDLKKKDFPYIVTDGKNGYKNDQSIIASKFGQIMKETAGKGVENLAVIVSGVSWSVIKIDEYHSRVVLVDPGYINPKKRIATIQFQNRYPKSVKDILSGEELIHKDNSLSVDVPAGSMRFIDISY